MEMTGGRLLVDLIRVDLMRLIMIDQAPRNDMIHNPKNPLLRGVARTAHAGRDGVCCTG
jgi:hypothetical protein